MASTGQQDRRGVEIGVISSILLGVLSVLSALFVSWILAVVLLSLALIAIFTWESASRLPDNNPGAFLRVYRDMSPKRPTLVCIGDSLTHGRVSADWTHQIAPKVSTKMAWDPPKTAPFTDPIWVVNAGQNSICSHTILNERLPHALACFPDFVMIMIGTNDLMSMHLSSAANNYIKTWDLPEAPSMAGYKRNLNGIVDFITQSSLKTEIGLCTLPPIGEDLSSPANQLVNEANEIVRSVAEAHKDRCSVIPIHEKLTDDINSRNNGGKGAGSVNAMALLAAIMTPLHYLFGISWKALSGKLSKNCVLCDNLHFNEDGAAIVSDAVVEWLFRKNVHKAIAVKQF